LWTARIQCTTKFARCDVIAILTFVACAQLLT
jgi:hypothetical protein